MTKPAAYEASVDAEWQEHVERIATAPKKKEPVYLVAAAGCGKTELIADAIRYSATEANGKDHRCCELVLTHTHAGVDALRSRIRKKGVPTRNYRIDTIAGWARRYASSFPGLSGLLDETRFEQNRDLSGRLVFEPQGNDQWHCIYEAAARLFRGSLIGKIVEISYTGLYVDEYQDCTMRHHRLILELAKLLPCRILGDHLQGIFDFKCDPVVNWKSDVEPNFKPLPELSKGWRWKTVNPNLGEWLAEVRECLDDDDKGVVDLRDVQGRCVVWKPLPGTEKEDNKLRREVCWDACKNTGQSVAVLRRVRKQCYELAKSLGGNFTCVEAMDCEDLMHGAERIEKAEGPERAAEVIKFAQKCMTAIATEFRPLRIKLSEGRIPKNPNGKHPVQFRALLHVAKSQSLEPATEALKALQDVDGANVYRKELLSEMYRALREFQTRRHRTLKDAAWSIRNQTRRLGRRLHKRTLGTTLLLKGLEFDHVIVLDADQLDKKNLYVALTRAKKSLTILSRNLVLRPRGRRSSCQGRQESLDLRPQTPSNR